MMKVASFCHIRRIPSLVVRRMSTSTEPVVDFVTMDKRENVTIISLNRPQKKNAVNWAMAKQLNAAMTAFEEDSKSRVAILRGNGDSFCSGYDLNEISDLAANEDERIAQCREFGPMGITRKPFEKPVIAALHGYVIGGGLEVALACDLRIATSDVIIGGFNRKWGVPFIDGASVRLPAMVGIARALDLILTGRSILSEESLSIGLVNRIANGDLMEDAFALAKQISSHPSLCLLTDRQNVYYSAYDAKSFDDAMKNELEKGLNVVGVDSVSGARKFLKSAKR